MRSRFLVLGTLVGVSGSALAQEPSFMIPNDREASAQVAGILASAREAGLPTWPIVGKVNYGVNARRSKPNEIVRAASIVKARLQVARDALAPNPTEQEITDGANALAEEGGTADMLRAVRKAGGSRSVAQALGLLTQLLASKVPPQLATERVTNLLRRGATGEQLVAMGNEISSDVRNGSQVLASLDVRSNNLIASIAAQGGGGFFSGDKVTISAPGDTKSTSGTPPPPPPRRP